MNETVIDPICGMTIDPQTAAGTSLIDGTVVHFCSAGCKASFDAAPPQGAPSSERPAAGCCGGSSCHAR